ncbi:MAG: HNH endonuclease [Deltaproteobacteria bacterium]|nr:MAG: HNH endonuclease [Deltaproteobacteria bacterium]
MLNTHVLILNNSFQPVHVCHARRALVLVMRGKAEVVEYYENAFIHSVSRAFQLPCVVRLRIYIQPNRRTVALTRRNIMRRDGYRCQYCGSKAEPLTTDHIIPRSMGGEDSWENLVTACVRCNNKKGNRTLEAAGMTLLSKPKRPAFYSFIRFYHPHSLDKWRPYLFMD